MKATLLWLISMLAIGEVQAQEGEGAVSVARSKRQKINTKPIYEARLTNPPKETGASRALQAVRFVQSKAEFMPDAQPALAQLVAFMRDNPTVEIELAGHTDNQGDFDQNVLLSKQRVDLVKAYVVQNGIAAHRITTRGYGPTRPIASNRSEATRQLNRRVEMLITKQ